MFMAHGDGTQARLYGDRKQALFADLRGTVVELGPGTGVNLPYLPEHVRWIGVEPNPHMHGYIEEKAHELGRDVELYAATLQDLDLETASIDAVISTLVLCSVPDLRATLEEVYRVLVPGGRFVFLEHVAAPGGSLLRGIQWSIKPVWRALGDGCRPDRETGAALQRAGFDEVSYERFPIAPPMLPFSIVKPHIAGVATKAPAPDPAPSPPA
jgi:ubiquinone/menaquinone biosynthesis C-methylase UbiE